MNFRALMPAILAATLAGCMSLPKERATHLIDRPGIDMIGTPADFITITIKDRKNSERYCLGSSPDVSLTASTGVELGLDAGMLPIAGGKAGQGASRGALALGGRNPAVLLARTLLYHSCELSLNIDADPQTSIAIYKMTLDSIERISALQTATGVEVASAAPPPAFSGLPQSLQAPALSTATITPPQYNDQE